jgi:hypothetical protein
MRAFRFLMTFFLISTVFAPANAQRNWEGLREIRTHGQLRPEPTATQAYTKEESIAYLDIEVRTLLDKVLRIYSETGLFTDKQKLFELLGASQIKRDWKIYFPSPLGPRQSYTEYFVPAPMPVKHPWRGLYTYTYTDEDEKYKTWHGGLSIEFEASAGCISSRAVEGYMGLPIYITSHGLPHGLPMGAQNWHDNSFTQPWIHPTTRNKPFLYLIFSNGCTKEISLGKTFLRKEVSDENIYR